MKKKMDRAIEFLTENNPLFRCPICSCSIRQKDQGLTCEKNHSFQSSKKGSIYFLNKAMPTNYDEKMFLPRRNMIERNMYAPMLEKIIPHLKLSGCTLDVGCGEGSFLKKLTQSGLTGTKIGFDISKPGIHLATNQDVYENIFWCVADLTNTPFAENSFDQLLNIFTPSHYQEFARILKPTGKIIKIIPEEFYLKELRQIVFSGNTKKQTYPNQKVLEQFAKNTEILTNERITYSFSLDEESRKDFLLMSPLEWAIREENLTVDNVRSLTKVTIDVRLLVGHFKH